MELQPFQIIELHYRDYFLTRTFTREEWPQGMQQGLWWLVLSVGEEEFDALQFKNFLQTGGHCTVEGVSRAIKTFRYESLDEALQRGLVTVYPYDPVVVAAIMNDLKSVTNHKPSEKMIKKLRKFWNTIDPTEAAKEALQ